MLWVHLYGFQKCKNISIINYNFIVFYFSVFLTALHINLITNWRLLWKFNNNTFNNNCYTLLRINNLVVVIIWKLGLRHLDLKIFWSLVDSLRLQTLVHLKLIDSDLLNGVFKSFISFEKILFLKNVVGNTFYHCSHR